MLLELAPDRRPPAPNRSGYPENRERAEAPPGNRAARSMSRGGQAANSGHDAAHHINPSNIAMSPRVSRANGRDELKRSDKQGERRYQHVGQCLHGNAADDALDTYVDQRPEIPENREVPQGVNRHSD